MAEANTSQYCQQFSPSYGHRIDDPSSYSWCPVPQENFDIIFFAGLAIAAACCIKGTYAMLFVLVGGGALMGITYPANLGRLGNSIALWLRIQPWELFTYIFLPPLLLDAAVRIDFFMFKKVALPAILFAFVVVGGSVAVLIPVMLYVLRLETSGWTWETVALFGSMVASTDAVAIVSVMKTCEPPGPQKLGHSDECMGAALEPDDLTDTGPESD